MTQAQRLKVTLEMVSTVAVLAAACAFLWTQFVVAKPMPAADNAAAPVVDVNATLDASFVRNVMGTGPIALVEFTDFECPFCARHATQTFPVLKQQLIDSGAARYVVINRPLPSHPHAKAAAEAAECAAEQGAYWAMRDELFRRQADMQSFVSFTSSTPIAGLQADRFKTCLGADVALARVKADQDEAERLEARGTPTVFVGRMRSDGGVDLLRKVRGAQSAEVFAAEVANLKGEGKW